MARGHSLGREYDVVTYQTRSPTGPGDAWTARVEITEYMNTHSGPSFSGATRAQALEKATAWCRQHEAERKARNAQVQRHHINLESGAQ